MKVSCGFKSGGLPVLLAILATIGTFIPSADAQNWTTSSAPVGNWVGVASSADGNKLAALVENGGAVYTSTNAGATWTLSSPANGAVRGSAIACSADGSIIYVAGFIDVSGSLAGQIYRSTNSGATWTLTGAPYMSWTSIACSVDGNQIFGTSSHRLGFAQGIFISVNQGTNWTAVTVPNDPWISIASSADGTKLVAADLISDTIYTSIDGGNSWAQHSPPLQAFVCVASSADGSRLATVSGNNGSGKGPIFVSTNSGSNWIQTTAPITNWVTLASSADGRTLIAAAGGQTTTGPLFLSTDSGATWNKTNSLLTHWTSVAASADGTKLVATEFNGHIYTLHLSPFSLSPTLNVMASNNAATISWLVPSMNFILQQSTDLTSGLWTDVATTPALNMTDLHNEVAVANPGTAYYRLISAGGSGLSSTQAIAAVLNGPWQTLVVDTLLTATFNADGSFTATIQPPAGAASTDSGTWALKPPLVPSGFSNPQANLSLVNTQGTVLLSGDVLLVNPDQLLMSSATNNVSVTTFVPQLIITKVTP